MLDRSAKIYIAGHTGLFGSSLVRVFNQAGFSKIMGLSHDDLDLTDHAAVRNFFMREKPRYVIQAAGLVGGLVENDTRMADFTMINLRIACNVIEAAHETKVEKLLYLGSSCIYPRNAKQPVKESDIFSGKFEPTNEGYAIAKIAGMRLCDYHRKQYGDNFISCIPANVYGEHDNFSPTAGHVIPALIARFHKAKAEGAPEVQIWGSGTAEREFLYVDDASDACLMLMDHYDELGPVNVGTGGTLPISTLANEIKEVVGYRGKIAYDHSKPDGMPKRQLDNSIISRMSWRSKTPLREGLNKTYHWYLENSL